MKLIKSLINIISKKRVRKIEVFNEEELANPTNHYASLFKAVKSGKIKSDEEAASFLYDSSGEDKKYLMFKKRFIEKLKNNLFFLDHDKKYNSEYFKAYYKANRDLFTAKMLVSHGLRNEAFKEFKQLKTTAQEYEFTGIEVEVLHKLRVHYSLIANEKKFEEISSELEFKINKYQAELKAEEVHYKMNLNYIKKENKGVDEKRNKITKLYDEIEAIRKDHQSFSIDLTYYKIKARYFYEFGYFEEAVYISDTAINELSKNVRFNLINLQHFAVIKILSYIRLKDFQNGKNTAQYFSNQFPKDNVNWLYFQEYYFFLAMHTRNYLQAYYIYQGVMNHSFFKQLPEVHKEKWKIFEAYLEYSLLIIWGKSIFDDNKRRFRIQKFLNEVPTLSKDKTSMNVAILIIQILFYLKNNQFDKIIDRMGAIHQYKVRYLNKKPNTQRSNLFIQLLQVMEKHDFDFVKTRDVGQAYYDELKQTDTTSSDHIDNLEVIPYENLWVHILNGLRHKEMNQVAEAN